MIKNILINKLKEKKATAISIEYVMCFLITVMLLLVLFEVILCSFTIFNFNVVATNTARSVSVSGGFTKQNSTEIYNSAVKQLNGKVKKDSVVIEFSNPKDNSVYTSLSSNDCAKEIQIDLADSFNVTVKAKVPFFRNTISNKIIYIDLKSTSSGVGEVYHKVGGINDQR